MFWRPTKGMKRPSLEDIRPTYWRKTSVPGMSSVAMWGTCNQGQKCHWPWDMCKNFPWKTMGPCVMCSQPSWILDTISPVSASPFWIPAIDGISLESTIHFWNARCFNKKHQTRVLSVDGREDSNLDMKTPIVPLEELPYTLSMVATISSQLGISTIQSNCPLNPIEYTGDNKTSAQVNSARVPSPLVLSLLNSWSSSILMGSSTLSELLFFFFFFFFLQSICKINV